MQSESYLCSSYRRPTDRDRPHQLVPAFFHSCLLISCELSFKVELNLGSTEYQCKKYSFEYLISAKSKASSEITGIMVEQHVNFDSTIHYRKPNRIMLQLSRICKCMSTCYIYASWPLKLSLNYCVTLSSNSVQQFCKGPTGQVVEPLQFSSSNCQMKITCTIRTKLLNFWTKFQFPNDKS